MLRLYRVTLKMPEMDSTGQSAPIRLIMTSSRLKELLIGQVLRNTRAYE
jgi:TusA-related sulfurtransferase